VDWRLEILVLLYRTLCWRCWPDPATAYYVPTPPTGTKKPNPHLNVLLVVARVVSKPHAPVRPPANSFDSTWRHKTHRLSHASFYTNNVLGSPPNQATCLASAALTMAQTPLNAVCAVTLVWNVFSVLYFTSARSGPSSARTFLLVIIPYVVFFICAGSVTAVGLIRPELVGRATFYCVLHSDVL
jgi:hypothetical protein